MPDAITLSKLTREIDSVLLWMKSFRVCRGINLASWFVIQQRGDLLR